ncbi:MAG: hypothetical protein Q7J16_12030 [Candidatus Cloacimonadales bacterium]|nr:hypothetical protein [Candidatus Cloacimonadales bacterium]
MKKIVVVGTSCSGKTTLAGNIAEILEIPHIELDVLHWGQNWTIKADFEEKVAEAVQDPQWVVDGNYRKVRDIIWDKADTIIWLNYSFPVVFRRALKRTISRISSHQELFGGNKESFRLAFFSTDSILWWVITTHKKRRIEYSQLSENAELSHLKIIQLNNQKEVDAFLSCLRAEQSRN